MDLLRVQNLRFGPTIQHLLLPLVLKELVTTTINHHVVILVACYVLYIQHLLRVGRLARCPLAEVHLLLLGAFVDCGLL